MKYILLIFLVLAVATTAWAGLDKHGDDVRIGGDLTVHGDRLTITGANSPAISIVDTTNDATINMQASNAAGIVQTTSAHPLRFGSGGSTHRINYGTDGVFEIGYSASGDLSVSGASTLSDTVVITGGNVGIGDTTPDAELDVVGDTLLNGNLSTDGDLTMSNVVSGTGTLYYLVVNASGQIFKTQKAWSGNE